MPLEKAAEGTPGFGRNIKREIAAGKPQKQAVAIAYKQARGDAAKKATEDDIRTAIRRFGHHGSDTVVEALRQMKLPADPDQVRKLMNQRHDAADYRGLSMAELERLSGRETDIGRLKAIQTEIDRRHDRVSTLGHSTKSNYAVGEKGSMSAWMRGDADTYESKLDAAASRADALGKRLDSLERRDAQRRMD